MIGKKIYTLLAAAIVVAICSVAAKASVTVYVTTSSPSSCYLWVWDNDNNYTGGNWPGVQLSTLSTATGSDGNTYYYVETSSSSVYVILYDGSYQTSDMGPYTSDVFLTYNGGNTASVNSGVSVSDSSSDSDSSSSTSSYDVRLTGGGNSWANTSSTCCFTDNGDGQTFTYTFTEGTPYTWSGQEFKIVDYTSGADDTSAAWYSLNGATMVLGTQSSIYQSNSNSYMPTLTSGTSYTITVTFLGSEYPGSQHNEIYFLIEATSSSSDDSGDTSTDTTVALTSDYNYYIVGDWNEVDGLWLPNPLGGLTGDEDNEGTYTATISDFYGEFKVIYVPDGRYDVGDATWYSSGSAVTLGESTSLGSSSSTENMYVGSSSTTTYSSLTFTLTVSGSTYSLTVTDSSSSSSTEEDTSGTDTNYYLVTSFNDYTYKAYSNASKKSESEEESTSTTSITYDISFANETAYDSFTENGVQGGSDEITVYVSGSSSYYMYAWAYDDEGNKSEPLGSWGGTQFSNLDTTTLDGTTYYYYTFDYSTVYVIFYDGSNQTENITVTSTTYYSYSGGSSYNLVKSTGSKVWAYAWMYAEDGEKSEPLGTWPGTNLSALTSYSANATVTLPTTTSLNFVVNNGHEDGTGSGAVQTRDIVPGAYYGNYYVVITGTQEQYKNTSANYQSYYTATSSGGTTQAAPSSGTVTIYLVPDEESSDVTACPNLYLYTMDTNNVSNVINTSAKATSITTVAGKYLWKYTVENLTAPLNLVMDDNVYSGEHSSASAGCVDITGIVADIYLNFRAAEGEEGISDDSYHTLALNMEVASDTEDASSLDEEDYAGWKFKTIKISGGTSYISDLNYVYFKAVIVQLNETASTSLSSISNIECTDGSLTMLIGYADDFGDLASSEYFYVQQGNTGNRYGYQNGTVTYASDATDGSVTGFETTQGWYDYWKGTYPTQLECDWTDKNSEADYMLFLIGTERDEDAEILTTENGGRYVAVLLATESSIASGIEKVDSEGNVIVAETYYTIQGLQVQNPEDRQFYIVVRKYADGSVKAFKEAIR